MRTMAVCLLFILGVGCGDSPTSPRVETPWVLLSATTPENVIANLVTIYNDTLHTADQRRDAYADLLALGFTFHFMEADQQQGSPAFWKRQNEIAAHENMFRAGLHRLELEIQTLPPVDIEDRPGWKKITATDVDLLILFNPNDGMQVVGGQADFEMTQTDNRWTIGVWYDRPSGRTPADEPATWGRIKASYGE